MNEVTAKKTYSRFGFTYTAMYWVYVACVALFLLVRNVFLSEGSLNGQAQMLIYFGIRFVIIYPVMYLLHGFANNRNSWFNYTSVPRYADRSKKTL